MAQYDVVKCTCNPTCDRWSVTMNNVSGVVWFSKAQAELIAHILTLADDDEERLHRIRCVIDEAALDGALEP